MNGMFKTLCDEEQRKEGPMYWRVDSGEQRGHTYISERGTSKKAFLAVELESQRFCKTPLADARSSNAAISFVWNGRLGVGVCHDHAPLRGVWLLSCAASTWPCTPL